MHHSDTRKQRNGQWRSAFSNKNIKINIFDYNILLLISDGAWLSCGGSGLPSIRRDS
jgi:hypothetical protein